MRSAVLPWVGAGALVWSTPAIAAAGGSSVVVAVPVVDGPSGEHIVEALQQGVRDGLADGGIQATDPPQGCTDATCLAAAAQSGGAQGYVVTEVTITGSDYKLVAEVRDAAGASLVRKEGSCEICTYEEAAAALRELVAGVGAELGPPPVAMGTISITSDPEGATVIIDGSAVGTTPHQATVEAGAHSVEISLEGHAPILRSVEVGEGATEAVDVSLSRQARLSPKTTDIIAYSAIGVGAVALIGGITMLVLDDNPVKSDCAGANVDADGDCAFRYDTLGGGIGLTVAGVVVAGGGVGLLLYSRKQRAGSGADAAEVSLVPGGLRLRF